LKTDFQDDPESLEVLESAKTDLEFHYNLKYAPADITTAPSSSLPQGGSPEKVDFLARYKHNKASERLKNELPEYFKITGAAQVYDADTDSVQWWYERRKRFPNLYRLVRNVLCIPGMLDPFVACNFN
jgi:hypothetical protein